MKKLQTKRLMSVLICGLALLLSSCTDQQDSPVPPANEDQQEELLQVADDFESRADFLAAAYKKTKPQITKVWDATVDPDDFVLLFVREDQKKIYLIDDNGKQEIPESSSQFRCLRGSRLKAKIMQSASICLASSAIS